MYSKNILIIGQDNRTSALKTSLESMGYTVFLISERNRLADISGLSYSFTVFPIPYKSSSEHIKGTDIPACDALCAVSRSSYVILGAADKEFRDFAADNGIRYCDINRDDVFKAQNAVLTAEAALSIAICSTSKSLSESEAAVIGYGAIGKQLTKLLISFGSGLSVVARKKSDRDSASFLGCKSYDVNDIAIPVSKADIVFNTVPAQLLTADILSNINRNTVIIDLASKPGGCDFTYSAEHKLNCRMYPSLPEQYSPLTSAKVFSGNVIRIIKSNESQ